MPIEPCELPSCSVIDRRVVEAAHFRDAYRAPLTHLQAGVIDIFFAVFGHHPPWIKRLLLARNALAARCGLDVPAPADIMAPTLKASYRVGDTIGPWPIFSLSADELVAGRNNKHLDFRLSVLRQTDGAAASVVVSTVCNTHNAFGKLYLLVIIPFHKWGLQHLMRRAEVAGRL